MNSPNLMKYVETLDLSDCLMKTRDNRENFCLLVESAVNIKIFRVSLQFPDLRLHIRMEEVEGNPNRCRIVFTELEGRMRIIHKQDIARPINFQVLTDVKHSVTKNGHIVHQW